MLRARLGDVDARNLIRTVAHAANAGVGVARAPADALVSGSRVVAHVVDAPLKLAEQVPLLGGALHELSPLQKMDHLTGAIQRGDFDAVQRLVSCDGCGAYGRVPGIGSGFGSAIATGIAVLDGRGSLEDAVHAAYGAIPLPAGLRSATDAVLTRVLRLAHQEQLTDAELAAARGAVPPGQPRDVFDTLVQLVVRSVPVRRSAGALVDHYVRRYASTVDIVDGEDDGSGQGVVSFERDTGEGSDGGDRDEGERSEATRDSAHDLNGLARLLPARV
jgi:hypothetical protein